MKTFRFCFTLSIFFLMQITAGAQSDAAHRLENNKFYISYIKDYIEAMKNNTDSIYILSLLNQMDSLAALVTIELDNIVLTDNTPDDMTPDSSINSIPENNSDYSWPEYENKNGDYNSGGDNGFKLPGLDIFNKGINTSLVFQFGLNGWRNLKENSTVPIPEINTGGSWFWEFGLLRKMKIGSKNSNTQFTYGLSYQSNGFRLQNDLKLTEINKQPLFASEPGLRRDPSLKIGYLIIPLGMRWNISGKFKMEAGVYAGYRVRSVQHLSRKKGDETSHEMLSGNWQLNDWTYGVSGGISLGVFNLIAKYNLSNTFRDNPSYDLRTLMFGTSIRLF